MVGQVYLSKRLSQKLSRPKGRVSLLNAVHDQSQHGNPVVRRLARGVLHQALKPFIFNMFDWLLSGEIQPTISVDFFIRVKDKEVSFAGRGRGFEG